MPREARRGRSFSPAVRAGAAPVSVAAARWSMSGMFVGAWYQTSCVIPGDCFKDRRRCVRSTRGRSSPPRTAMPGSPAPRDGVPPRSPRRGLEKSCVPVASDRNSTRNPIAAPDGRWCRSTFCVMYPAMVTVSIPRTLSHDSSGVPVKLPAGAFRSPRREGGRARPE